MNLLFPRTLSRLQYCVLWLLYHLVVILIALFVLPLLKLHNQPNWVILFVIVPTLAARILCLDIPRIHGIGWPPGLLLLHMVPGANLFLQILLFCKKSKEANA